jgi:3-phosphoshikimate 1-carboxyvinyltransferase
MTESLLIKPFRTAARGVAQVPGSKSITNRALILAALAEGETLLTGALFSRDTKILIQALRTLGFVIVDDEVAGTIRIQGNAGNIPVKEGSLHVGNAGTAARFLTAFLALSHQGKYAMDGDVAMRARPMSGLLNSLASSKTLAYTAEGKPAQAFPFVLQTSGQLKDLTVDASASSQLLSALLMVLPLRAGATVKMSGETVSEPFVVMTERMCAQFGRPLSRDAEGRWFCANPGAYLSPEVYAIEPDATAASYFIALPAVTGQGSCVRLQGYQPKGLQGDTAFAEVAKLYGADMDYQGDSARVRSWHNLRGGDFDFNQFSDTFLTLAALAPLADKPTVIRNIAHTRKQETDRLLAMATELNRLGVKVEPSPQALQADASLSSLTIYPSRDALLKTAQRGPTSIHTYEDHRMAMSFGILGSYDLLGDGTTWIKIEDPGCTGKTFPRFFQALEALRSSFVSIAIDGGAASGKSSTARAVAQHLGLMHVDTGAHYRTLTVGLLSAKATPSNLASVENALAQFKLDSVLSGFSSRCVLNGKIASETEIRSPEVNAHVSAFAALPVVRNYILNYQRSQVELAREAGFAGLIMEGRDIGSVVLPNATLRIFLEADAEARRLRRSTEGQADSIAQRDLLDSTRAAAPLICPTGAVRIDNTKLSLAEVVQEVERLIAPALAVS